MAGFHEKINDWLIPAFLGAAIYYLQCMTTEMQNMNRTLAVAVERVEQLERRTTKLESERP